MSERDKHINELRDLLRSLVDYHNEASFDVQRAAFLLANPAPPASDGGEPWEAEWRKYADTFKAAVGGASMRPTTASETALLTSHVRLGLMTFDGTSYHWLTPTTPEPPVKSDAVRLAELVVKSASDDDAVEALAMARRILEARREAGVNLATGERSEGQT